MYVRLVPVALHLLLALHVPFRKCWLNLGSVGMVQLRTPRMSSGSSFWPTRPDAAMVLRYEASGNLSVKAEKECFGHRADTYCRRCQIEPSVYLLDGCIFSAFDFRRGDETSAQLYLG